MRKVHAAVRQRRGSRFIAMLCWLNQTGAVEMTTICGSIFAVGCRVLRNLAAGVLILGAMGCQSDKQAVPGHFAAVLLSGNTPGQIRNATVAVFADNGYKTRQSDPDRMVFEKQGSRMNNFAY